MTLDLSGGSTDGGDNIYTACGTGGPNGNGSPNQGLYNLAELDMNNDGTPDASDDACGDLPDVTLAKTFVGATVQADGSYDVVYTIAVTNTGGALGTYGLTDTPSFDDDVTINSGSFTGEASGTLTSGTTTLATNNAIAGGTTETFTLTYNVTLDLSGGSTDGGDNVYTACGTGGPNGNGSPNSGLYNLAELDTNNDGTPDAIDDACGDIILFDLAIEKTIAPGNAPFANTGDPITYMLKVTNQGATSAINTSVMDNSDIGLMYLSDNVSMTGGNVISGGNGSFIIGSLSSSESVSFLITYLVLEDGSVDVGDILINRVQIDGDSGDDIDSDPNQDYAVDDFIDGIQDDDEDIAQTIILGLNVEKTANKSVICPGEEVEYTLTSRFRNNVCADGAEFRDLRIVDNALPGYTFLPGDQYFVAESDPDNDGILDCGEQFMWRYTMQLNETFTNVAKDTAVLWFVNPDTGEEILRGTGSIHG